MLLQVAHLALLVVRAAAGHRVLLAVALAQQTGRQLGLVQQALALAAPALPLRAVLVVQLALEVALEAGPAGRLLQALQLEVHLSVALARCLLRLREQAAAVLQEQAVQVQVQARQALRPLGQRA